MIKLKYDTKVIEFIGAPNSGKSTLAHQVFGWLKTTGVRCTFLQEAARDLIECGTGPRDQFYVTALQAHRLYNILGEYEYVVMDTSLLLGLVYIDQPQNLEKWRAISDYNLENAIWAYKSWIQNTHAMTENITFYKQLLDYSQKGQELGRIHDNSWSKKIDRDIKDILTNHCYDYIISNDLETCQQFINIQQTA